jgi:hypothetical protein
VSKLCLWFILSLAFGRCFAPRSNLSLTGGMTEVAWRLRVRARAASHVMLAFVRLGEWVRCSMFSTPRPQREARVTSILHPTKPRLVVGKLKAHGLKREPTPKCSSGFKCSDKFSNPFEYGHIMGWELGGPNFPTNIVPMYAEWQGSPSTIHESWRNMEIEIGAMVKESDKALIFVAAVEYVNTGDDEPGQSKRFKEWSQLFDWNDYRIPTWFRVYVETADSTLGQRLGAQFLNPGGLGTQHFQLCAEILKAYPGTAPAYSKLWDHSKLPPQDREALIRNSSGFAVQDAFLEHQAQREVAIARGIAELQGTGIPLSEAKEFAPAPLSPTNNEHYFFINQHKEKVQEVLARDYGLEAEEAKRVTPATMIQGYYHGVPAVRNVKLWVKRNDENKRKQQELLEKTRKDLRTKLFLEKRTS